MDHKKTGRLIRKKREELGLTENQLSQLLYCTTQAISSWELGKRYPDYEAQIL